MEQQIADEVKEVLTVKPEELTFEKIQGEDSSPLNQPVVEKDIAGEKPLGNTRHPNANIWKPELNDQKPTLQDTEQPASFRDATEQQVAQEKANEPLDAPEQQINAALEDDQAAELPEESYEVPLAQANQAADAILGMTNNMLEVGGGYFVKLKKHEDFYEFEEIVKLIDEQNDKNVQRIKLDKEDQALLRPLLSQVLRKKSKKLTPEQQLMGAVITILMKKAQVVMEVRAENALLESRILQIVRDEKGIEVAPSTDLDMESSEENPEEQSPILEVETEEVDTLESSILDVSEITKNAS